MKKILLVHPPFHAFFEYDRWGYPINCCQLASCLREKGFEAFVYDGDKYFAKDIKTRKRKEMSRRQSWYEKGLNNENHDVWKHFRKTLEEIDPDVVGLTMWTSSYRSGVKILQITKEFNPKIQTCVGGYHITAMYKPNLDNILFNHAKYEKLINCVFIGPSEESFPNWIENGYKEKIIKTNPLKLDVKRIPAPSRESLLYQDKFTSLDMGMIMTSRGCPYDCSFCSNKLLTGKKYQFRTVMQVRKEIENIINKYGVTHLNVVDANFFSNIRKAMEMVKIFKSFNITWTAPGHIHAITNERFLKEIIDYGCTNISIGIEACTQERLLKINKESKLLQIENAGKLLNKSGINWKAFFITGWPDDTLNEMEQVKQFALKLKPTYLSLNSFSPLPGTDIYDEWKETFDPIDVHEYNQLNPKATFLNNISLKDYKEKFLDILNVFDKYNAMKKENKSL